MKDHPERLEDCELKPTGVKPSEFGKYVCIVQTRPVAYSTYLKVLDYGIGDDGNEGFLQESDDFLVLFWLTKFPGMTDDGITKNQSPESEAPIDGSLEDKARSVIQNAFREVYGEDWKRSFDEQRIEVQLMRDIFYAGFNSNQQGEDAVEVKQSQLFRQILEQCRGQLLRDWRVMNEANKASNMGPIKKSSLLQIVENVLDNTQSTPTHPGIVDKLRNSSPYNYEQPEEIAGERIWNECCDTLASLLSEKGEDKDLIIQGLEEGSEQWKAEYDNCRAILQFLVELKRVKDTEGKTEYYEKNQPIAWDGAKKFLEKYQHQ